MMALLGLIVLVCMYKDLHYGKKIFKDWCNAVNRAIAG